MTGFSRTPEIAPLECQSHAWAACLAYMLSGYGADLTTDDVLAHFDARGGCRPSDEPAMLMAASGLWSDGRHRRFLVNPERLPSLQTDDGLARAADRLTRQPLLCGVAGHTTIITEIVRAEGPMIGRKLEQVSVRDPLRRPSLRHLGEAALSEPFWIIALSIRPVRAAPRRPSNQ